MGGMSRAISLPTRPIIEIPSIPFLARFLFALGGYGSSEKVGHGVASGTGGESLSDQILDSSRKELIEGPEGAYTVGRIKIGTFTRDSSLDSGTQEVTGVGGRPYMIFFIGVESATREVTWGFESGTNRQSVNAAGGSAGTTFETNAGASMRFDEGGGALYEGIDCTLDADGFTVTWSRSGAPTGTLTVRYAAFLRG